MRMLCGLLLCAACSAHALSAGVTTGNSSPASNQTLGAIPEDRVAGEPKPVYLPDGRLDKRVESGKLWTVLEGFSPDEAVKRARAAGYLSKIEVVPTSSNVEGCAPNTVCRVDPFRWELDVGEDVNPGMRLIIKKTYNIAAPE